MRIVAVDAGNTRIKWGVWEGKWCDQGWLPTDQYQTLSAAWERVPRPYVVFASNVAGHALRATLDAWATSHQVPLHWLVSRAEQCGVRSAYRDPAQLGPDRWASLIAARQLMRGAALVVNAGTAVTIDALDAQGMFLGGVILPGLALMASALVSGTAGLPQASGQFATFPDNTADAIASGAVLAVSGAIDRMRDALAAMGPAPRIVLSGGAASALAPHLTTPVVSVPYLVLEGLRVVAEAELGA
jgi:type III pantothenate kinase